MRRVAWRPWGLMALAAGLVAALSALLFQSPALNYDTAYSLVWGGQLVNGEVPDYTGVGGPTPHPLLTAAAAGATLLGRDNSYYVTVLGGYLAGGALMVALFRCCQLTGSKLLMGAVACLVTALSFGIVINAVTASKDIAFAALVISACVLEGRRPRRGAPVLAVLGLAGLIRPDAWLVAGLYWLYLFPGETWRSRLTTGALVASAPLIWMSTDLIVTGDPLFSLTRTQDLAVVLGRATGITQVPSLLVQGLRDLVGLPAVIGGAAGLVLSVVRRRAELLPVAAVAVIVVVVYAVQGAARLPLTGRLLITLAVALAVFFAFALLGWVGERDPRVRRWWAAGALAMGIAFAVAMPARLDTLDRARRDFQFEARVYGDLRRILIEPSTTSALHACPTLGWHLYTGGETQVPYLAYLLARDADTLRIFRRSGPIPEGLILPARSGMVDRRLPPDDVARGFTPATFGHRRVAGNSTWAVYVGECS